jgi:hypothetical protein
MPADPERVDAVANRLRATLISGVRKRVTPEVEQWGRSNAPETDGEELLAAYNSAAVESEQEARQLLEEEVLRDRGKQIVIALLNRQGTTDRERIAALETLAGLLEPAEIPEFARVSAKQRAAVVPKTIDVLARVPCPESAFALRRLFGEGNGDASGDARRRAAEMLSKLEEAQTLLAGQPADDSNAHGLVVAGTALEPEQQAELRHPDKRVLRARLAAAADELDRALVVAGRRPSGLNDYEGPLRRHVHLLTLVADLPAEPRLRERVHDTLFAEDLERVERLAEHLPVETLGSYVERALAAANRRRRPDRARLAARLLIQLPSNERARARAATAEMLLDSDPEIQVDAAVALATAFDDLSPKERAALLATHDALPANLRARLAPHLGGLAADLAADADMSTVIEWAAAAPDEEAGVRLAALFERWRLSDPDPHDVATVSETAGDLLQKLSPEERASRETALAAVAAGWLRRRGGTAAATRALLSWPGFASIALGKFDEFVTALPGRGARRLLLETVRARSEDQSKRLGMAASMPIPEQEETRLLYPVLTSLALSAPDQYADARSFASEPGRRRLLVAALDAHREAVGRTSDLEIAMVNKTTEALVARRQRLLDALAEAERESKGNDGLLKQFATVRRALALALDDDVAGEEPSEDVRRWRQETAARLTGIVEADGGEKPLRVRHDAGADERLVAIMTSLDRRTHARGSVPAADRGHYGKDLEACAKAFVASGQLEREGAVAPAARRSPELTRLLDDLWADDLGDKLGGELTTALVGRDEGSGAREALRLVDTLAAHADQPIVAEAVGRIDVEDLDSAWRKAMIVLRASVRRRDELSAKIKRQEREAMTHIADRLHLPFQAIESYVFGYFRLRQILEEAGWGRATPHLGAELDRAQLNPERHEIRGEKDGDRFVVRSLGITALGSAAHRAIVEALEDVEDPQEIPAGADVEDEERPSP